MIVRLEKDTVFKAEAVSPPFFDFTGENILVFFTDWQLGSIRDGYNFLFAQVEGHFPLHVLLTIINIG